MKYQIGQIVWHATWSSKDNYVTCPDCGGTGRLRVTFHDETQVSIDCQNCSRGYEPPKGVIHVYDRKPVAEQCIISGYEVNGDQVEYRTFEHYRINESDLFESEPEALERAAEMSAQADTEEREKIFRKEKDTRSWAWNATYHRREIERAKRNLEYHTKKLSVASLKAKEDKVKAA